MSADKLKGKQFLKAPGHFIDEATEQVEELKSRHSIVSLFEGYGVKLSKSSHNGSYTGLCPWHDDHNPSLSVDETKGLFHCFGCDAKGDVIELVRKMENLSFRDAIRKLEGTTVSRVVKTERKKPEEKKEPEKVAAVTEESGASSPPFITLNDVCEYYHKKLFETKPAIEYLEKRGIVDKTLYERFQIGFSDGSLLSKISDKQKEQLVTIGIIKKRDNGSYYEHFHGCIVFPITDDSGQVVGLYGRRLEDREPKHLYLAGQHKCIWNRKASKVYDEIAFVESIIDALSLIQIGIENVQPLYGVNGFTAEHLQTLKDDNVKTIILALDNDEAGRKASDSLKTKLLDEGFAVKTIFPKLTKDWNEELVAGLDKDTFKLLIEEAKTEKKKEPEKSFDVKHDGIKDIFTTEFTCAESGRGITYEIVGAKALFVSNLRVNVKAICGGESYYDNADLSSGRSRRGLAETLAQLFNIEYRIVERDLMRILDHYATERDKKLAELNNVHRAVEVTDEDRELGLSFLKNPAMFDEIVQDMETLGYVGEDVNKKLVYIAASSRKLDDPISVVIVSQSGAGKSFLVEILQKLMPDEDVISVTSLSDQALNYMAPGSLLHKILILGEALHSEEIERQIREMLSGKRLSRMVVLKDDKGGAPVSQQFHNDVIVSLFMSTTRNDMNPENASRCFIVNADESEEQTERIQARQREKHTFARFLAKKHEIPLIIRKHKAAQRLLRTIVIVNNYGKYFRFPKSVVRTRRDHDRFVDLVVSVCFLRQYQKETKTMSDPASGERIEYIECDVEDYRVASSILKSGVLDATYSEIPKSLIRFYDDIRDIYRQTANEKAIKISEVEMTQREIRKRINWISIDIAKRYLRKLMYYEYIALGRGGSRGMRNTYQIITDEPLDKLDTSMIPTPEEIADNLQSGATGAENGNDG